MGVSGEDDLGPKACIKMQWLALVQRGDHLSLMWAGCKQSLETCSRPA